MSKFRKEFSRVNPNLTQAITDVAISRRGMMKLLSAGAVMSTGLIGFPEFSFAAETPVKGANCVLRSPTPRPVIPSTRRKAATAATTAVSLCSTAA